MVSFKGIPRFIPTFPTEHQQGKESDKQIKSRPQRLLFGVPPLYEDQDQHDQDLSTDCRLFLGGYSVPLSWNAPESFGAVLFLKMQGWNKLII